MQNIKNLFNRKIINDPKLQYGIVGFFVLLGLINIFFIIVLLSIFKSRIMSDMATMDESSRNYMTMIIEEWSPIVLNSILIFGGFSVIFSFVCGLALLQQIAGPMFVIKKYLQETLNGRVQRNPIHLRKYDYFKDVADLINQIDTKFRYVEKNKTNGDSQ